MSNSEILYSLLLLSCLEGLNVYLANKDEKYTFKPSKEINSYNINKNENALKSSTSYRDATSDNNFSNVGSSSSDFHNHQTSPAYSYLSYNVYNNDNKL